MHSDLLQPISEESVVMSLLPFQITEFESSLSSSSYKSVNIADLSEEPLIFSIVFLFPILSISALIFTILFLPLALGLAYPSFSSSLSCKFRLLI